MTLGMMLGLIAIITMVGVGSLILDIKLSEKASEKRLREYNEYMATVDEMLEEKAKREGGRRITNWEEYSYLSDLWNC